MLLCQPLRGPAHRLDAEVDVVVLGRWRGHAIYILPQGRVGLEEARLGDEDLRAPLALRLVQQACMQGTTGTQ